MITQATPSRLDPAPFSPDTAPLPDPAALIAEQRSRIMDCLMPLLHGEQRCALLDFPAYSNVGDSAIYLGVLEALKTLGIRIDFVCHRDENIDGIDALAPEGVILLLGGGNFGDLWLGHQDFRESVIERYRHRRIIQLPQSIYFNDPKRLRHCASLIAAHPDFTLLVRDHPSLDLAQAHFECPVQLCPDTAFLLGPQSLRTPRPDEVMCLLRTDAEIRDADTGSCALSARLRVEDWLEEIPPQKTLADRGMRWLMRYIPFSRRKLMIYKCWMYRRHALLRLNRGLHQLGSARIVVTDRLHGHILSSLLGLPHVVMDNSYGKIVRYIEAFGRDNVTLLAGDQDEAWQKLDELRSKVKGSAQ